MKTRKTTFASTVVAAAFGLALGFISAPAQANPADENGCHDHKPCEANSVTYTAQLTAGAFVFVPMVVTVVPNSRNRVLWSDLTPPLDMVHPDDEGALEDTWDDVFIHCPSLLLDEVLRFEVASSDWSIDKAGGVRIRFRAVRDITLDDDLDTKVEDVQISIQLIGDEFDFEEGGADPFLPEKPGDTSTFDLFYGQINGRTLGGGPKCQPPGVGSSQFPLGVTSTLKITAN